MKRGAMKTTLMNYKELNEQLQQVVLQLQSDDISIDDALKAYEEGTELIEKLEDYLKKAKLKITEINTDFETKKSTT
ncbi:MAG: hypothetical protein NVSMB46_08740 [Candidatus Saccharimonadales bacterium]